eukprot:scaffold2485_cov92-Isochrysis_galbana.AAC.3
MSTSSRAVHSGVQPAKEGSDGAGGSLPPSRAAARPKAPVRLCIVGGGVLESREALRATQEEQNGFPREEQGCLRGGLGTIVERKRLGGARQPVDSAWELRRLRRPGERGAEGEPSWAG